jgi:transposase, IS5 family
LDKAKDKGKDSIKAMKEKLSDAITLTRKLVDQAKQVVSNKQTKCSNRARKPSKVI